MSNIIKPFLLWQWQEDGLIKSQPVDMKTGEVPNSAIIAAFSGNTVYLVECNIVEKITINKNKLEYDIEKINPSIVLEK